MSKVIQNDESMIPEGVISIRPYGLNLPWRDVGNNSAGTLNVTTESRNLPNYRGGGGNRNVKEIVGDVTAALGLYDLTAENIASYDCIIIATDHDAFDYELLLEHSQLIVDTRGRLLACSNVVAA